MTGLKKAFLVNLFFFPLIAKSLAAQDAPVAYASLMNSPHDFDLFANAGWDGNWYIGFNSMWIVELTPPPQKSYDRVFVGAKLGRAKTRSVAGRPPWIRSAIDCDIYIGAASTPAWKSPDSYFLTSCQDIPVEGNSQEAITGTGESRWYWREIPLSKIQINQKNYLAVWSTTAEIIDASSGPILAAGKTSGMQNAWLNRGILGAPPLDPQEALETRLNEFAPALAIKFIASRGTPAADKISVELVSFKENQENYVWEIQVQTKNLERVRPEISIDAVHWTAFGRPVFGPPLQVTVSKSRIHDEVSLLTPGNARTRAKQAYIRITAWNEWEDSASTDKFTVIIKN
ncbi:MAG: hypothetical protein HY401_07710 [Elusimicrobia bacterium]|nr:hypothetical protein [Elusimicrobiota bacterium]